MSEELSRSEIEEILNKDSEIVAVHWPKEYTFGNVNKALWSKDVDKREKRIHLLEEYLMRPCIEDTFEGDLLARKQWKEKHREGEWGVYWLWYKDQDALRWGAMRVIPSFCEGLLDDYIGPDKDALQSEIPKVRQLVPKTFQEYDSNSTAKKIEIVVDVKEAVYRVLQQFYVESPASSPN